MCILTDLKLVRKWILISLQKKEKVNCILNEENLNDLWKFNHQRFTSKPIRTLCQHKIMLIYELKYNKSSDLVNVCQLKDRILSLHSSVKESIIVFFM